LSNGTATTQTRHFRTLFELGAVGGLSDGQLLERFTTLRGDPAELAFAALVERHGPMVLRVARSALIDEHSAHDAFQATFLILARKARSLWVRDSLGPWLHSVAYRLASQSRSAEARRRLAEKRAARPEAHQPREWDRSDIARVIHQEIERLPQPFRLAVVTCHLEGLTQNEAANRLGWPIGTLQSRLDRGRQKLRNRLKRRGLAPSLGVIAGKFSPVPHALTVSTAKAASTLHFGGATAGMIAPAVLAMIETTTKGMLMTKLKFGAVALVIACGLVGSGMGLGIGRSVQATDGTPSAGSKIEEPRLVPTADGRIMEPAPALTPQPDAGGEGADQDSPTRPLSLLYFHAPWESNSRKMTPVIQELARHGLPVRSIDVGNSDGLRDRYKVDTVPTYIIIDKSGKAYIQASGVIPPEQLSGLFGSARAMIRAESVAVPTDPLEGAEPGSSIPNHDEEPSLTPSSNPKPWETVVRIKIKLTDEEWGFGSGTVISSSAEESIILTCGHIFRLKDHAQPLPKEFRVPISVDLFGNQFVGRQPTRLACTDKDISGEVIDYDFTNNVGLIRIRTGRRLPASRVVPTSWQPKKGMPMTTVGCSHGNDATAWSTTILDPQVGMSNTSTKQLFAMIKCANQPEEGRSGGGLYTSDGYLAGVCALADPNEHVGFYAVPEAIHKLLDRNGLSDLYQEAEAVYPPLATEGPQYGALTRPVQVESEPPQAVRPAPKLPDSPKEDAREPSLIDPITPRPWETVVRIKVPTGEGYASGAIIDSNPDRTFILTCARPFRKEKVARTPRPKTPGKASYDGEILVNLTDGHLTGQIPATSTCLAKDHKAELVVYDSNQNLAVIAIRPGQTLPASPIYQGIPLGEGSKLYALGCSEGGDATAWETEILATHVDMTNSGSGQMYPTFQCRHVLRPGREGGGLYTKDGQLVGIALFNTNETSAFYARPEAIKRMLDRNGLAKFYHNPNLAKIQPSDQPPAAESEIDPEVIEERADGSKRPFRPIPSTEPDPVLLEPISPSPRHLSIDRERLDEMERKLDRLLKQIEVLTRDKPKILPEGAIHPES
jgi:RNA polymerase sigma factor (sigma-70 family)